MKSHFLKSVMAVIAVALLTVGCEKDPIPTPPTPTDPYSELTKVAEFGVQGAGVNATVYMDEDPFMGYNIVYVVLKDSVTKALVENAQVTFEPLMDMGSMVHSAPWEAAVWDADAKAFVGSTSFIMIGEWTFKVMVKNQSTGAEGDGTAPITVIATAEPELITFTSAVDGAKYFVALVQPKKPKVGYNDFEIAVYKKETMMSFPAVSDLNIAIEPTMPSMGHGSPNNVNPVALGSGHYKGTVNFTMTGYWEVAMTFKDAANALMSDAAFFGITL